MSGAMSSTQSVDAVPEGAEQSVDYRTYGNALFGARRRAFSTFRGTPLGSSFRV
jgi:hypothetical protein